MMNPVLFTRTRIVRLLVVLLVAAVSITIRLFLVQDFGVPTGSMKPTIDPGSDVLVVDHLPVRIGEIVVFRRPNSTLVPPYIHFLIKRVVAVGGETVQSIDGRVYVDGHRQTERYLPHGVVTTGIPLQVVPRGDIFVLGDNRENSCDSRCFGPVPVSSVVGVAVVTVWPVGRWTWLL